MEEVCRLLRGIAAGDGGRDDEASAVSAASDYSCDEDVASDRVRTGMILNDIGVSLGYETCKFREWRGRGVKRH